MDFRPMEGKDKLFNKYKLGLAIQSIIELNKKSADENAVTSLRKLAAASGVEYAIIQKISTGQKDPQFTTILAIAEGFGIGVSELLSNFEDISDQTVTSKLNDDKKKAKKRKAM